MSKILSKFKNCFYFNRFLHGTHLCNFVRRFSDGVDTKNFECSDFSIPSDKPKVVIIGAGISGLSAADYLMRQDFTNVVILEASQRYGGRIHSVPFGDATCELGAKWLNVSNTPNSLHEFVRKHGVREIIPAFNEVNYTTSKGEVLNSEISQAASMMLSALIGSAKSKISSEGDVKNCRAYLLSEADEIATKIFKDHSPIAKKVFGSLFRDLSSFVGCDLSNVSITHLSQIAKSFSNPFWISSGISEISRLLANSLFNSQLLLGKPVGRIRWSKLQPWESPYVTCLDGSKYIADHIICTLPLGTLKTFNNFLFDPNIPKAKENAISKLGVGYPGKIYLEYARSTVPWFFGALKPIWSVTEMDNHSDWCMGVSEISSVPGSETVLEIKIGGIANEEVERCSDKVVVEKLTQLLRRFMKSSKIPFPKGILRSFWSTDSCFLGGQSYLSINSDEANVHELSLPLTRYAKSIAPVLLFAGDATIRDGFGTLEGARQSGIREAKRIINFYAQKMDQGME